MTLSNTSTVTDSDKRAAQAEADAKATAAMRDATAALKDRTTAATADLPAVLYRAIMSIVDDTIARADPAGKLVDAFKGTGQSVTPQVCRAIMDGIKTVGPEVIAEVFAAVESTLDAHASFFGTMADHPSAIRQTLPVAINGAERNALTIAQRVVGVGETNGAFRNALAGRDNRGNRPK